MDSPRSIDNGRDHVPYTTPYTGSGGTRVGGKIIPDCDLNGSATHTPAGSHMGASEPASSHRYSNDGFTHAAGVFATSEPSPKPSSVPSQYLARNSFSGGNDKSNFPAKAATESGNAMNSHGNTNPRVSYSAGTIADEQINNRMTAIEAYKHKLTDEIAAIGARVQATATNNGDDGYVIMKNAYDDDYVIVENGDRDMEDSWELVG